MSDDLANQGRSVGRDLNNGFPVTVERCHIIEQMADRIEELEAELRLMKTSGIIEVAVRNPNVMEYMRHWEGRAEAAEVALEKAMKIADEGRTSGRVSRFMYELTGGKDE